MAFCTEFIFADLFLVLSFGVEACGRIKCDRGATLKSFGAGSSPPSTSGRPDIFRQCDAVRVFQGGNMRSRNYSINFPDFFGVRVGAEEF